MYRGLEACKGGLTGPVSSAFTKKLTNYGNNSNFDTSSARGYDQVCNRPSYGRGEGCYEADVI
jgi:hypothetical protein